MGAFPRDNRGPQPLAVFEYRALASDKIIADLLSKNRLVPVKAWTSLVQKFYDTYVKS
jgi:hypothetical protein